jgi:hypothetical protein
MKNVLCISVICLSLLSGCAVHRKLFYTETEMKQYNAEEQAKLARENAIENAINRVFNISSENDKEKFDCQFIALETTGSSVGFTTAGDMSIALHNAKEVAVEKGGNAIRLLMSSTRLDSSSIIFEVHKCKKSPFDN